MELVPISIRGGGLVGAQGRDKRREKEEGGLQIHPRSFFHKPVANSAPLRLTCCI